MSRTQKAHGRAHKAHTRQASSDTFVAMFGARLVEIQEILEQPMREFIETLAEHAARLRDKGPNLRPRNLCQDLRTGLNRKEKP